VLGLGLPVRELHLEHRRRAIRRTDSDDQRTVPVRRSAVDLELPLGQQVAHQPRQPVEPRRPLGTAATDLEELGGISTGTTSWLVPRRLTGLERRDEGFLGDPSTRPTIFIRFLPSFWVSDATSSVTTIADTTPPTVTGLNPASGATNVAISATVTVTFSEALNASTVSSSTVFLRDANSVVVPAAVAYNSAAKTVTLTPTSPLANSMTYTIVVKSGSAGVKDLAGNALVSDSTSSFTTIAASTSSPPVSLWTGSTTPAIVDSGDANGVELGMQFTSDSNGVITGLRFYKSAANVGTHTASLWTASGQLLATATFTAETASGWQQVNFASPVAIVAGTTYVASYHTAAGHYSVSRSYFSAPYTSNGLHVPTNGGVYRYGTGGFPSQTYQGSNYWVDVLFSKS